MVLDAKDEDILKMFVIALHIANFLLIIVELFNSTEFFSFTINSFMFFSSTSIGVYSLEPRTKIAKQKRVKTLKTSFWSAVGCVFFMILSMIEIDYITIILLLLLKLYTVITGFYCTSLLIKIDSEVSNNEKKYSKNLKEIMKDSIIKKTPNEIKAEHNKKSESFITKIVRKGNRK